MVKLILKQHFDDVYWLLKRTKFYTSLLFFEKYFREKMARNIHQKTTEKLSDFIKYSGHHDMSKCDKMRYADLLQEGILENMTTDPY